MQLIAALVFIGILMLLLALAAYLARSQKSRNDPYKSWSQVLGPQFSGSAFDVGDNLKKEIEAGRQQSRRGRQAHHRRSNQR